MRDVPWLFVVGAACVMFIVVLAPWQTVDLDQESGAPILARGWHFAPWDRVVDGEPRLLDPAPYGTPADTPVALILCAGSVAIAGTPVLLRPLAARRRACYGAPALLAPLAKTRWQDDAFRLVRAGVARAGRKQICDVGACGALPDLPASQGQAP